MRPLPRSVAVTSVVALLASPVVPALHGLAHAQPVGSEFQVNTYTTNIQLSPAVAPDGAGGFVVVWQSDGSSGSDTGDFSVQAQRFSNGGTPVGSEFQVNTYTTSFQGSPAVAADGAGGFVVVWESGGSSGSDTDGGSIQGQRFASPPPVPAVSFSGVLLAAMGLVLSLVWDTRRRWLHASRLRVRP